MQTLLIVDDDVGLAAVVARGLREEGYRVVLAHTGPEALVVLNYLLLDLVICDVMLPELNGDRIVTVMQSHPRLATIPVIMTSALPAAMYPSVPAAAWVQKPYRWAALHGIVRAILAPLQRPPEGAGAAP